MAHDPLAQFRKAPVTPAGGMLPPRESDEYLAFGTKDKVRRLRIRSNPILTHSPAYNLLLDVVSDGQYGTLCILVYTILLVKVQGKNLQKLVYALENGMADFIQAFDPERWKKPADANAAVIDSIEVQVTGGSLPSGETQH
jgi:hypothetical protein